MIRVRFAPSPTGSLHVGGALSAVANRRFADEQGGVFLLRIDDTDAERNVAGGEQAILDDLEWLGVTWDEGPVRQRDRAEAHRAAAGRLEAEGHATRSQTDRSASRLSTGRRSCGPTARRRTTSPRSWTTWSSASRA